MAGGGFNETNPNKIQPGVFINRVSAKKQSLLQADKGVVVYCADMDWGDRAKFITIESIEDCYDKLGYYYSNAKMRPIVEMFRGTNRTKGANKVLVYIPTTSTQVKAGVTIGNLTIQAKCYGARGNDISVVITPDLDTEISTDRYAVYTVKTLVDGIVVNSQTLGSFTSGTVYTEAKIGDLVANDFVVFSGTSTGTFTATAGTPLTGGVSGSMTNANYGTFLLALEKIFFHTLCYDGTDSTIKAAIDVFIRRQCESRGNYCQAVLADYNSPNYEGVISIKNGQYLTDGFYLDKQKMTWWIAGCTAGANYNESLTHARHPLAKSVDVEYSSTELDELLKAGQFVMIDEFGIVMICDDINTFRTYTESKGSDFSSNRTLRVLNDISNYCYYQYDINYVGVLDNNEDGRDILKADICAYISNMQANNGVTDFTKDDVTVEAHSTDKKAVNMYIGITPVDAIAKIYIKITAQ